MKSPYQVKPTSAEIAAMLARIQLSSEILRTAEANPAYRFNPAPRQY